MVSEILIALSPIILILLVIFIFKKSLAVAAPITCLYTVLIVTYLWKINNDYLFASALKGFLVALDIVIIIFGAIFFLEFLRETKMIDSIDYYLSSISSDRRIQAIILVWFFGSFIEGTAGFGTPAAIVAPLLVGLGFSAITAVAIALIGNSTAVTFGAVGTPIRIGFSGLTGVDLSSVAFYTGLINLIAGAFVPLMILSVVVLSSPSKSWKRFNEMIPYALFSGIVLTVPYFLFTFLGQEFPSLLGPLVGLAIIVTTTKKGFLVPKNKFDSKKMKIKPEKIFKTLMPYILLILFLLLGKFFLSSYSLSLAGTDLSHSLNLFNPGFAFVLSVLLFSLVYKVKSGNIKGSALHASSILFLPFVAILFITTFVQIMINSGNNISGMSSMIEIIANSVNTPLLPFLAPVFGAFGAFIAGSATVSNILFGNFQSIAAENLGYSVPIILALQLVGAGVGNMIALTNIVTAQATVKLHGKENEIIRKTAVPFIIYLIIVGIIGFILINI